MSCSGGSSRLVCVIPVSHLNTGIQGPSNIIISLNRNNYLIITIIGLIINYLIIAIIRVIIMQENLH